jgi:uncharacterized cysteine cluster protein YcgN (CxxCxxCC family)
MEIKEETCKRCGICCHVKIRFLNKVYIDMSRPCKYLDTKTNLCTIYEDRLELQPYCKELYVVLESESMPSTCGYVEELKKEGKAYKDPVIVEKWD